MYVNASLDNGLQTPTTFNLRLVINVLRTGSSVHTLAYSVTYHGHFFFILNKREIYNKNMTNFLKLLVKSLLCKQVGYLICDLIFLFAGFVL